MSSSSRSSGSGSGSGGSASAGYDPPVRQFQDLPISSTSSELIVHDKLRILQFNILADGLSGLRPDLGAFSRVKREHMNWDNRKHRLLQEILQYDPDVITLQECDHYYDFFLFELMRRGYSGHFAPKPASACLEVSTNSDGCAIFHKKDVLEVISSQVRHHTVCICVTNKLTCLYAPKRH